MIRYAFLLFNMLGLLIYQLFFSDGVSLTANMPKTIDAGGSGKIEVHINKGNISGFAKLQQELPQGVKASIIDAKGASFSFSGNIVKFIWTSLPNEQEFVVSYKIDVDTSVNPGAQVFGGKFYYVVDNVKQAVDVPELTMTVNNPTKNITATTDSIKQPSTSMPTAAQIAAVAPVSTPTVAVTDAIQPAKPSNAPAPTNEVAYIPTGNFNCTRKISVNATGDYTVELTITRSTVTGFAKIQENIPTGFVATNLQSSGASFNFVDQKVKFIWVNLPSDPEIKISYKLTGSGEGKSVDGLISYLANDATQRFLIAASTIPTGAMAGATPTQTESTATATSQTQQGQQLGQQSTSQQQSTESSKTKENTDAGIKNITSPVIPAASTGVNYKVQVCALRQSPVNATYFTNRFGISNVSTESHEGWTKYTSGGFDEYKSARDYREVVKTKGIQGPFVAAYNSGKRITVQEALMISKQKWFK